MPEWTPLTGIDNYVEGTTLKQEMRERFKEALEADEEITSKDVEVTMDCFDKTMGKDELKQP
jgi:hypothetical protein